MKPMFDLFCLTCGCAGQDTFCDLRPAEYTSALRGNDRNQGLFPEARDLRECQRLLGRHQCRPQCRAVAESSLIRLLLMGRKEDDQAPPLGRSRGSSFPKRPSARYVNRSERLAASRLTFARSGLTPEADIAAPTTRGRQRANHESRRFYSIASPARASSVGGTVSPSAFEALHRIATLSRPNFLSHLLRLVCKLQRWLLTPARKYRKLRSSRPPQVR
jgi:hypothetical protein